MTTFIIADSSFIFILPSKVGPSPLNSPATPSCITMWVRVDQILECLTRPSAPAAVLTLLTLLLTLRLRLWPPLDWSLVLTTSSGEVTTAPVIPPTPPARRWCQAFCMTVEFADDDNLTSELMAMTSLSVKYF